MKKNLNTKKKLSIKWNSVPSSQLYTPIPVNLFSGTVSFCLCSPIFSMGQYHMNLPCNIQPRILDNKAGRYRDMVILRVF